MIRGCAAGIYATFQIESIRSTRSSIRYILDGYAPRDEQEARIYGMKRGLEFIANRQNCRKARDKAEAPIAPANVRAS